MNELLSLLPAELAAPALAAAGVVAAVWALLRRLVPFLRRLGHLVDDLIGEPARPGHPTGRPGLMDRVTALEDKVETVRHEVEHNDGSSLKDATRRTESAVKALTARVNQIADREQGAPVVQQDIRITPDP